MNGKVNRKIENRSFPKIILKTKQILELERKKHVSLAEITSPDQSLKKILIDWLRKQILGGYLTRIAEQQNEYNNQVFGLIKELYSEIVGIQMKLYGNKEFISKDFFDKNYFEGGTKSTYLDYSINEEIFKEFARIIKRTFNPKKVLDAGCAYGFLVKYLRAIGIEAYGIDISEFAVQKANSPYVLVGDITNLKRYHNKEFDFVICTEVFEHLPQNQAEMVIKEFKRISSKWIILTIATKEDEKLIDLSHINIHGRDYWYRLFEKKGLRHDFIIEQELNNSPFSTRTQWRDHYFVFQFATKST